MAEVAMAADVMLALLLCTEPHESPRPDQERKIQPFLSSACLPDRWPSYCNAGCCEITCWRYSLTYCSARLKISLRWARAFFLASRAASALAAAQASLLLRFLSRSSGTAAVLAILPVTRQIARKEGELVALRSFGASHTDREAESVVTPHAQRR